MKIKLKLVAIALLINSSIAGAQNIKIFVYDGSDDSVGGRLYWQVKDGIRKRERMSLVDRLDESLIQLHILTFNPEKQVVGTNRTTYSVTWTIKPIDAPHIEVYLSTSTGTCDVGRLIECADSLLLDTDREVSRANAWINVLSAKQIQANRDGRTLTIGK